MHNKVVALLIYTLPCSLVTGCMKLSVNLCCEEFISSDIRVIFNFYVTLVFSSLGFTCSVLFFILLCNFICFSVQNLERLHELMVPTILFDIFSNIVEPCCDMLWSRKRGMLWHAELVWKKFWLESNFSPACGYLLTMNEFLKRNSINAPWRCTNVEKFKALIDLSL